MSLWLPPGVTRELLEERQIYGAEVQAGLDAVRRVEEDWTREVKRIDPYLEVRKARHELPPGTPLKPGFWHVIRHNPDAPVSVMTIEGPNGEYMEPNSSLFDLLKSQDLQNPQVGHMRRKREREIQEAKERRERAELEELNEDVYEHYLAGTRTQVSMNRDTPWHQNHAGRRGARR